MQTQQTQQTQQHLIQADFAANSYLIFTPDDSDSVELFTPLESSIHLSRALAAHLTVFVVPFDATLPVDIITTAFRSELI